MRTNATKLSLQTRLSRDILAMNNLLTAFIKEQRKRAIRQFKKTFRIKFISIFCIY